MTKTVFGTPCPYPESACTCSTPDDLKRRQKVAIHSCANAFSQHPGKCAAWCGDARTCPAHPKARIEGSGVEKRGGWNERTE